MGRWEIGGGEVRREPGRLRQNWEECCLVQKDKKADGKVSSPLEKGRELMTDIKVSSLVEHFGKLEDPRIERTKLHQLNDILVIAVCAVICGADNWVEVEKLGRARE